MELVERIVNSNKKLIKSPKIDGFHRNIMFNTIVENEEDYTMANNVFSNATKVLPYFSNPDSSEHSNVLCIGKVQSGKTAFFTASVALAFDNGYSIAYLLGGTKNKLKEQNEIRMLEEFKNDELVKIYDVNKTDVESIKNEIENGKKIIIIVLKNASQKTNLGKMIELEKKLYNYPSIIVDDEADEVTPGAPKSKRRNNKAGITHDKIAEIISSVNCCTYLSVTATPQANILLNKYDELSPDFVTLVYPGKGYCGGNSFHDIYDNPHTIEIKDNDDFDNGSIPKTFIDAFHDFIFACCLKNDGKGYSMLVHPSRSNVVQNDVAVTIDNYLQQTIKNLNEEDTFAYQASVDEIFYAYQRYVELNGPTVDFSEIKKRIPLVAKELEIFIYNVSLYGRISMKMEKDSKSLYRIYIGGDMLGRGLTFRNLIVTYIYRDSKVTALDTLYQRARWFGYKEEYFDVCKVFMTKTLKNKFIATVESENDMWNAINNFLLTDIDFKSFPRILSLPYQNESDDKMILTRTSVSKTIEIIRSGPGFNYDKSVRFRMPDDRKKNRELYESFYDKYKTQGIPDKLGQGNREKSLVIDMKYTDFYNDFLQKYAFPLGTKLGSKMFSRFIEEIEDGRREDIVKVVIMRYKTMEQRSTIDDWGFEIGELLQGRSNDGGRSYVGDKNIFPDIFHIQIHLVYHDDKNDYVPMLAVQNPLSSSLIKYVTGDEYYDEVYSESF